MKKFIIPFVLIASLAFLNSCEKKEDSPDFAGKWSVTSPRLALENGDTIVVEYKETFILAANDYNYKVSVKLGYNADFIDLYEEIGKLEIDKSNKDQLNISLLEEGNSKLDSNGKPTGVMVYRENRQSFSFIYKVFSEHITIYSGDANMNNHIEYGEYYSYINSN
jgi:hypothetical protein